MKKKILSRCLLGAPIGVLISIIVTIIISLCIGKGEYCSAPDDLISWCGNEINAVIVQTVCALVIGAISAGSSVIWEIEKWSLTKQTLVHFAVLVVPFISISYVLNWMPHNLIGGLSYAAAYVISYVLIWLSIFLSVRAKIKKMNKQIQSERADEKQE